MTTTRTETPEDHYAIVLPLVAGAGIGEKRNGRPEGNVNVVSSCSYTFFC